MVPNQLNIPTSGVSETIAHFNTLKRPSFRTASSGSLLESQIPERKCERTWSVCTTPSLCDMSLSSWSSVDTTYPNMAHISSPQSCMQLPTLQAFQQGSGLLRWMPMPALPYPDSQYVGQFGVQTSSIMPQSYSNGIIMHQGNEPGQMNTAINVPWPQHNSGLKIHAPHSGLQDTNSDIYSSLIGNSSDAYITWLNSHLVPYGNINSSIVLYHPAGAQNMLLPATQTINTMPPFAPRLNEPSMKNVGEQSTKGDELWRIEGEEIWVGECKYEDYQEEGCSNLFAT